MVAENNEKRKFMRYKLDTEKLDLIFESDLHDRIIINNGAIRDISYIGMGIISSQLPEIGSIITLDFKLSPEGESIISLAKVVWIDKVNNRFGVEFITPTEEFMKEAVSSLVNNN